jgi:NO-binding membrane sensor protein with MHYT domain
MKKALSPILVIALWVAITTVSTAQSFRLGIKAGAGLANLDYAPLNAFEMAPFDYYKGGYCP